jgi:magnesium and cobalt transporter
MFGKPQDEKEKNLNKLDYDARDMIKGIVELSQTTVKEVMVPRIDVIFLSKDIILSEMFDMIINCGHSRFPVYEETIDNVIGILYAKDLLKYFKKPEEIEISEILRKPYFIPESKRLDTLLREFKRRHVHIAISVDEYGGVSGIVCLEDIIEEIVGDIQDEFDNEVEDILKIDEYSYLCDGRVDIEDLNKELSLAIPEEDFDTLGGFVFDLFGKIPVKFEKISFNNTDFIIQDMDGHKIKTVKIVSKANN